MKQQHIALVALFNDAEELLLLKRGSRQHCAGTWSFPGGKVEPKECAEEAAIRELFEETGLRADGWRKLGEREFHYPECKLHFHLFRAHVDASTSAAMRCEQVESPYGWYHLEALQQLEMPAANQSLLALLM